MYAGWSGHRMPQTGQQLHTNASVSTCGCKVSCAQTRRGARRHSRLSAVAADQQARQAARTSIQQNGKPGDWFFSQRGQQDWVSNPVRSLHQPGLVLCVADTRYIIASHRWMPWSCNSQRTCLSCCGSLASSTTLIAWHKS